MAHTHPAGKFTLKLFGVAPGGQPEIERGVYQLFHLVGIEYLSTDGNRGFSRYKSFLGPLERLVLTGQLENLRP